MKENLKLLEDFSKFIFDHFSLVSAFEYEEKINVSNPRKIKEELLSDSPNEEFMRGFFSGVLMTTESASNVFDENGKGEFLKDELTLLGNKTRKNND